MSQTKEKCDSLALSRSELWIVWRWHGISHACCYFFYLEPMVRKDAWMRMTSVTVMAFFFKSGILKVTSSQLFSKFLYNRYEAHWKQHFERYPAVEYFPDMDQLTRSINIKTSVSIKQKSMTVLQKRSVAQKSKCALRRTSNLSRPRFTYFIGFFFSQT